MMPLSRDCIKCRMVNARLLERYRETRLGRNHGQIAESGILLTRSLTRLPPRTDILSTSEQMPFLVL